MNDSARIAIPLHESPAKRFFWRAVRVLSLGFACVVLGWVVLRAWSAAHWWGTPLPAKASSFLLIEKNADTLRFAQSHLSDTPVIEVTPASFTHILTESRHGLLLVTGENNESSLIVDAQPSANMIANLNHLGYKTNKLGGKRLWQISKGSVNETVILKPSLRLLWNNLKPGYDGELFINNQGKFSSQAVLTINDERSLTLHTNLAPWIQKVATPSNLGHLEARLALTSHAFSLLNPQVPHTSSGLVVLLGKLKASGGGLFIGHDPLGSSFRLTLPTNDVSTDDLVIIGTDLLAMSHLSTLGLTLENGNTAKELRLAQEPTVTIREDGSFRFIALNNEIFITVTPTLTLISNRPENTGNTGSFTDTCLKNSWGSVSGNLLKSSKAMLYQAPSLHDLFTSVNSLSFNNHKLRFCW